MQGFGLKRGKGCKVFGLERHENGAEGADLENFSDFSEKLLLANAIKSKNLGIYGYEIFSCFFFEKFFFKTAQ